MLRLMTLVLTLLYVVGNNIQSPAHERSFKLGGENETTSIGIVESPDAIVPIRRKRDFGTTAAIIGIIGTAVTVGETVSAEVQGAQDGAQTAAHRQKIMSELNELNRKHNDLARTAQSIRNRINEFEGSVTNALMGNFIREDLNILKSYADYLKQTTLDANGIYGPESLLGHGQIPGRLRRLRLALDNFHRYMTKENSHFDQKNLIRWYLAKTSSTRKAEEFKWAMMAHQIAGYEYLNILYWASCQQQNPGKSMGFCHANEMESTKSVTNLERTRMEAQAEPLSSSSLRPCPADRMQGPAFLNKCRASSHPLPHSNRTSRDKAGGEIKGQKRNFMH